MSYIPELLAPCGEFKSVIGAVNAGANAIYIGASSFSARAYAKNFEQNELIDAIHYAHLNNCKVYIALNILIKNTEFEEAVEILKEPYIHGLDGVIVQDLGLISVLSKVYPDLLIHASTQLSIMSDMAVPFLKELSISRVVPARELSLNEIKAIKDTGIEVESFIHGAMCYSYSGKCLFSSMAGGRSGNRGRCAGPCRKPYNVLDSQGKKLTKQLSYPISMKDMCCAPKIKDLIAAKVDSFKIEGRMKAPEYSAGVTAVYRNIIDREKHDSTDKDLKELKSLYIRSDIEEGYLNKHNGANMISMSAPSYSGINDAKADSIRKKYIDNIKLHNVSVYASIYVEQPITVVISDNEHVISLTGPVATKAEKKALSIEDAKKQLSKLGGTFLSLDTIQIDTDGKCFVPVSVLNELRREAVSTFLKELMPIRTDYISYTKTQSAVSYPDKVDISIGITNEIQLKEALKFDYYNALIFDIFGITNTSLKVITGKKIYIRLPEIIRKPYINVINSKIEDLIKNCNIDGIYVSSIDGLMIAKQYFSIENIHCDSGVYVFNTEAESLVLKNAGFYTLSYELNEREMNHFHHNDRREMLLYSYLPLMNSANCILNTIKGCNNRCTDIMYIEDEKRRAFPVRMQHEICNNIIYNYLPLNLINEYHELKDNGAACNYRLELTIEDADKSFEILKMYENMLKGNNCNLKNNTFTLGHYKRGVE